MGINLVVLLIFLALIRPFLATRGGQCAAILVLGGAIGNVIDRINLGFVVDYVDVHVWPVFNFADVCVVCGVGILVLLILRAERAHLSATGGNTP